MASTLSKSKLLRSCKGSKVELGTNRSKVELGTNIKHKSTSPHQIVHNPCLTTWIRIGFLPKRVFSSLGARCPGTKCETNERPDANETSATKYAFGHFQQPVIWHQYRSSHGFTDGAVILVAGTGGENVVRVAQDTSEAVQEGDFIEIQSPTHD